MIKPLRKRHLQIWILCAVLIPIGVIVAWMAVPKKVTQELLQPEAIKRTRDLIFSIDKQNYRVNLYFDSTFQLEFINRNVLSNLSLLLYKVVDSSTDNIDKQELIGRIQGKGSHNFPFKLDVNPNGEPKYSFYGKLILYDIIKKQKIDSIIIKPPL
jgi:hypothetical protein